MYSGFITSGPVFLLHGRNAAVGCTVVATGTIPKFVKKNCVDMACLCLSSLHKDLL